MNKRISIITINYNNLEGLKKTVESVTNQTWKEFEYIVIDGGSTDGSATYLESQTDKITYWVSEKDKGIYNAMNKGILKASGEYLLFLNSGDHFYNNEVLKLYLSDVTKDDLVYFDMQIVKNGIKSVTNLPKSLKFSDLYFATLPHPSTFIKKTLFENMGLYDETLKIVADWKFFILALFKHNCTYKKIEGVLTTFYMDGISSDIVYKEIQKIERLEVFETHFKGFLEDVELLEKYKCTFLDLKKSRKINWLIKIGLLNNFLK